MYGTTLNWDEIKMNLISHYADKRTETSLIRDLHSLKQFGRTVEKFYSEIIEIQSSLTNNVMLHETNDSVITAKKNLFSEMCLNAFLSGLREPMGSIVRAMQPVSLPSAFEYCIKEQNIHYLKTDAYKTRNIGQPGPYVPQSTSFRPYHNFTKFPISRPGFRPTNHYSDYRPFRRAISYPQCADYTNQQRSYSAGQTDSQNYPNHQPYPFKTQPPPEPMDTGSGFSKFGKNTGQFKSSPSTRYSRLSHRNEVNNINQFRSPKFELPRREHDNFNYDNTEVGYHHNGNEVNNINQFEDPQIDHTDEQYDNFDLEGFPREYYNSDPNQYGEQDIDDDQNFWKLASNDRPDI